MPAFAWIEIDCPGCGIDFDLEPDQITPGMTCSCGAVWDDEVLAGGNAYDAAGYITTNPFRGRP